MKSILITGVAGFLGYNTAKYFKASGCNVTGIDVLDIAGRKNPVDKFIKDYLSLASLADIGNEFDVIVHCAGSGSVAYSNELPLDDFERNVTSLLLVLEYMRLHNTQAKLIYPSSAAVYGQREDVPISESDPCSPISPYGFHKMIGEVLCKSYGFNFHLNISVIRFFSLYGVGLRKQLLWDACDKFMKNDKIVCFSGNGKETRDWLNVNDAVSLIYRVAEARDRHETVNGGSGEKFSISNILNTISREMGKQQQVVFDGKIRPGDPRHYHANISKARSYGWEPVTLIEAGIKEYVAWYRQNR
jgi:UDP-glucose 4-epimerase